MQQIENLVEEKGRMGFLRYVKKEVKRLGSRESFYDDFKAKYVDPDNKILSWLVYIPEPKTPILFKNLSKLLVALLLVLMCEGLFIASDLSLSGSIFIFVLLCFAVSSELFSYRFYLFYAPVALLSAFSDLNNITKLNIPDESFVVGYLLVRIMMILLVLFLSVYLWRKLAPGLTFLGVEQDKTKLKELLFKPFGGTDEKPDNQEPIE